ncbi:glycosyltransferase [Zafaria cholistanensis]|uniref:glycosyltransferase n=1 Tax=Zafaria cholistanensis TaxID=1682741 RepID=UPI0012316256|nr:glycosyltransferase family 2 protein [Zafaria cholistanensis]
MHPRQPSVSLVIPAYNEEAVIGQCVAAALRQSVPAREIIVVDNRSTDRTAEIVRRLQREHPQAPLRLARQDAEQGLVPTRNAGLGLATGDVLGRIDADSVLEPDWVEQVAGAFLDPEVMGATGPVHYYDMPLRRWGLKADDRLRQLVLNLACRQHQFLFGSNMALRRTAWEAISGEVCRDEADQMHEDIDISLHLAEHHLKIRYVPTMVAGMSARRLEDSPGDYRRYVARFGRTYRAHRIERKALRIPELLFLSIYYPARTLRYLHGRTDAGRRGISPFPATTPPSSQALQASEASQAARRAVRERRRPTRP